MPRSLSLRFAFALLLILTCARFVIAQNDETETAVKYSYGPPINFTGASDTYAYAINNKGEVVGFYTGDGCPQSACGFIEIKGKFTSIECAVENATEVFDISNKGEIIGAYAFVTGVNGFILEGNSSCFSLGDSSFNPPLTEAWGVNDNGQIVGFYQNASGNYQGFEYVNGKYTTISCAGFADTRALGINDAGVIVGDVWNTSTQRSGFMYKSGKCTTFDYPKAASTTAVGINKSGQISGWYVDSSGAIHGLVKTGGHFQALNYHKAFATFAFHLNDAGKVAGFYQAVANGPVSGFVASPEK
jgi:probable HAF family extracellular repeat protein